MINWYLLEGIMVLLAERKWEQKVGTGEMAYELPALSDSLTLLAEKKKTIDDPGIIGYAYDQRIAVVNLALCENVLQPQKATQKDFDEILMAYRKIWATVGSKAKKMSEIEQLGIIIDALASSEQRPVIKFCKMLTGVNDSLEKM